MSWNESQLRRALSIALNKYTAEIASMSVSKSEQLRLHKLGLRLTAYYLMELGITSKRMLEAINEGKYK